MSEVRPAGFWIRAVALLIDVLVLVIVEASLKFAARRLWGGPVEDATLMHGMTTLFTLIFAGVYVTLLHAGTGQTIGKLVVRAHVVLLDGAPLPVGVSLLRSFAYLASWLTFGHGFLMAGLRHDKRALHDLIAGTRVERRLPERAAAPIEPSQAAIPPVA